MKIYSSIVKFIVEHPFICQHYENSQMMFDKGIFESQENYENQKYMWINIINAFSTVQKIVSKC